MARYRDSICKLCRRHKTKLFLKGDRCYTDKCAIIKRKRMKDRIPTPGQHGLRSKKLSDYGIHLYEKQKVKVIYGVLERQFRRYFKMAEKQKGITGENLLIILERRLDNVIYRLGFAKSRSQARQLINHGHIFVSGKKVRIPSYLVKQEDTIEIDDKMKNNPIFEEAINSAKDKEISTWLQLDADNKRGKVLSLPTREQIDQSIKEQLVVEFYAR